MRLSAILPIALLAVTTFAYPVELEGREPKGKKTTSPAATSAAKKPTKTGSGTKPTSTSSMVTAVKSEIDKWLDDIKTMNNFVDTVIKETDPKTISTMAHTALKAAQDESSCLTAIVKDVKLDSTGQAAADALPAKFTKVGQILQDTIDNPSDMQKNVDTINTARCGGAIKQYGDVQQAAAKAVGIKVPEPEYPAACN